MKLGKSEAFGVFNKYYSGVGNVHAHLNNCGGNKYFGFAARKGAHYFILFRRCHFAVKHTDLYIRKTTSAHSLGIALCALLVAFLVFFNKRADYDELIENRMTIKAPDTEIKPKGGRIIE